MARTTKGRQVKSKHPPREEAKVQKGKQNLQAHSVETTRTVALSPLSETEKSQLRQSEEILRAGLQTFLEVGNALLTIRDGKLYRATHPTFESYCHDRWHIGRSYAWRVMGAAERVKLLPADSNIPKPTNEFQIRPFLKLEPEIFPKAWEQAIRKSKEAKLTPGLIREVITEIAPDAVRPRRPAMRSRKARPFGTFSLGEVLILLADVKRRVEKQETREALAALEKAECLLLAVQKQTSTIDA